MQDVIKPVAHLLCGFIGSGKTSLARKLEVETGAARFTKDEWMVKLFGNNPPKDKAEYDTFHEYDTKMAALATEMALKCLVAGGSIIIDDGFWYRKQRDEMREDLKKIGAVAKFYYLDAPVEVMRGRTVTRSENPPKDSFYITGEEFDGYLKLFEPPADDEDFTVVKYAGNYKRLP